MRFYPLVSHNGVRLPLARSSAPDTAKGLNTDALREGQADPALSD